MTHTVEQHLPGKPDQWEVIATFGDRHSAEWHADRLAAAGCLAGFGYRVRFIVDKQH